MPTNMGCLGVYLIPGKWKKMIQKTKRSSVKRKLFRCQSEEDIELPVWGLMTSDDSPILHEIRIGTLKHEKWHEFKCRYYRHVDLCFVLINGLFWFWTKLWDRRSRTAKITQWQENGEMKSEIFWLEETDCGKWMSDFVWLCDFWCQNYLREKSDLFCFGTPPPSAFYDPQLQIICCYIARYYVRKEHVRRGVIKNFCLLRGGGGGGRNRE